MKIGVYLCGCGGHISEKLDLPLLERKIAGFKEVSYVKVHELMCSDEGMNSLVKDLLSERPDRVVIAACSPLDHEDEFRSLLEKTNINPYLMQMVNIREQVAWVSEDTGHATSKALVLSKAAIDRVCTHQPLWKKSISVNTDAIVIGAGPAGLTAALTLAETGRKVVLVEKSPSAGGKPAMFDEIFPDLECGSCRTSPLVNEVLHGEFSGNIELLTLTSLVSLRGYFGNFTVTLERSPRFVDVDSCISCGECVEACPVVFRDSAPGAARKLAMDFPSPGALPHVPKIDMNRCLRTRGEACTKCRDACPVEGTVIYENSVQTLERKAGAIVVATGAALLECDTFKRLGYGQNQDVVTAIEFERLLLSHSPNKGKPVTSSSESPARIAIIQCVGSLDPLYKPYCSTVCCRYALKYSAMIRKRLPETEVMHFVREWCLPGQSSISLFSRAVEDKLTKFIRYADLDSFKITASKGQSRISFRDERGALRRTAADMIVLCPAVVPEPESAALASLLDVDRDEYGFFRSGDKAGSIESDVRGIFAVGACREPMDIRSSADEGRAAAGRILAELRPGGTIEISPEVAVIDSERCTGCMICRPICPFKAVVSCESGGKAEIIEELCRGCGICAASCPASAITSRHFSSEMLIAEIRGILNSEQ